MTKEKLLGTLNIEYEYVEIKPDENEIVNKTRDGEYGLNSEKNKYIK